LSVRNAKEKPESPSQALIDYFGAYKDEHWDEFNHLQENVNKLAEGTLPQMYILIENETLNTQIHDLSK
jgi:hypothetical protein